MGRSTQNDFEVIALGETENALASLVPDMP